MEKYEENKRNFEQEMEKLRRTFYEIDHCGTPTRNQFLELVEQARTIAFLVHDKPLIVSRHQGAIEFVKSKGFNGDVVEQFSPEMIKKGRIVIGILPVHLITEVLNRGARFIQIQLPEVPLEMRGKELTPEQMVQYGAKLVEVEQLVLKEI